jgi:glycosyltransferase involved in cell wall biosynthesis
VLQLVDVLDDGAGGAERFAVGLARSLPAERFEVAVCATRRCEGALADELAAAGISCFALGRRRSLDVLPFRHLAGFLRRESIDVLHAHMFGSNAWGSIIGRACRVPVVLAHEHTWSYEGRPLRRFVDGRVIGRLATRFLSVSSADRERMIRIEGVPGEKALTLPTAYVPRDTAPGGDLRAELGIAPEAQVIGTIARLRVQKALHVLIEAVASMAQSFPDARLVIVGDGPDRARLEHAAAPLGERVVFAGPRTDLDATLAAFDVAAMSSDFEGLPLFVFEAMAHRTPLVATRVGGIPDVVEHGVTGVLVPPGDADALAEALGALLNDPDRRGELAAAAHERLAEFTIDSVAARFAALYEDLLAESSR